MEQQAETTANAGEEAPCFVGINVAGGAAYLGVVRAPDELLLQDPADRIEANDGLPLDRRLEDFRARVAQELRRIGPESVGVSRTRRYRGWSYQSAFGRFTLEAAAILAAVQENFPCYLVKQEDAARAVGVAAAKLVEQMAGHLGIAQTPYWDERSFAFATALALAKGDFG